MTSSERIMGAAFVNHWMTSTIGWTIAVGILTINASDVYEFASNEVAGRHWVLGLLIATVALYLTFVLYLTVGPIRYPTAILYSYFVVDKFVAVYCSFCYCACSSC